MQTIILSTVEVSLLKESHVVALKRELGINPNKSGLKLHLLLTEDYTLREKLPYLSCPNATEFVEMKCYIVLLLVSRTR